MERLVFSIVISAILGNDCTRKHITNYQIIMETKGICMYWHRVYDVKRIVALLEGNKTCVDLAYVSKTGEKGSCGKQILLFENLTREIIN